MHIRHATYDDFDAIMQIYADARRFQAENGNPNQWANGYPQADIVRGDIDGRNCMLCIADDGGIAGVFALFDTPDPTYAVIDGAWINDAPYLTVHRIAGNGKYRGIVKFCTDWVYAKLPNVRIDTHHDNSVMRHILPKIGFHECGIVITDDGTPRIAFQKCE